MAVDSESNKVVGAVLAKDHNLGTNIPFMKPLTVFCKDVNNKFVNKNPNFFLLHKVAILFFIGVNENYRKKQIAFNLIKSS